MFERKKCTLQSQNKKKLWKSFFNFQNFFNNSRDIPVFGGWLKNILTYI